MTIFINNLQRTFKKPSSWVYVLVIPILINIFIVTISVQQAEWYTGVTDHDDTRLTQQLIEAYGQEGTIVPVEDPATVREDLNGSSYDIFIEFPEGYTQEVIDGKKPVLTVTDHGDEDAFYEAFEDYAEQKFHGEYLNFDGGSTEKAARTITTLGYLSFGMVLMMSSIASMLLRDRLDGIYDRVQLSPVSASSYFGQYFLSMVSIAVVQLLAVLLIVPLATPIGYGETWQQTLGIVIAALAFTLFTVAKSMVIYRFSSSMLMAGTITSVIDLPMLMLGGALWPRDVVPEIMQQIGQFSPVWWFLDGAEYALRGEDLATFMVPVGALLALAAVLFIIMFSVRTQKVQ